MDQKYPHKQQASSFSSFITTTGWCSNHISADAKLIQLSMFPMLVNQNLGSLTWTYRRSATFLRSTTEALDSELLNSICTNTALVWTSSTGSCFSSSNIITQEYQTVSALEHQQEERFILNAVLFWNRDLMFSFHLMELIHLAYFLQSQLLYFLPRWSPLWLRSTGITQWTDGHTLLMTHLQRRTEASSSGDLDLLSWTIIFCFSWVGPLSLNLYALFKICCEIVTMQICIFAKSEWMVGSLSGK